MARHRSVPGFLRTGDDGRRDHQNEAMSNNKVAHVASVPAAMKSACGLVGSSSSSDIANSLSRWGFKGGRLQGGAADPSISKRRQADYPIGLRRRWLSAGLLFSQLSQPARTGVARPPREPTFRSPSAAARRPKWASIFAKVLKYLRGHAARSGIQRGPPGANRSRLSGGSPGWVTGAAGWAGAGVGGANGAHPNPGRPLVFAATQGCPLQRSTQNTR